MENKLCASCGGTMEMKCEPAHEGEHAATCKMTCASCGASEEVPAPAPEQPAM
ncbi:MAG: hypothetical protein QY311_02200 [Candidatus Paceibacterota bacterium]|nr:MAG: hypothetical protein QY311_02200 [Candidatus Paceibacterota bacterium]